MGFSHGSPSAVGRAASHPSSGALEGPGFEDSEQIKDAGERAELSARVLQSALQPAVRLAEDLHDQAHRAPRWHHPPVHTTVGQRYFASPGKPSSEPDSLALS